MAPFARVLGALTIAVVSTLVYRHVHRPCRYDAEKDAIVCDYRANLTSMQSAADATQTDKHKRLEIVGNLDGDCRMVFPVDGRLQFEEVREECKLLFAS